MNQFSDQWAATKHVHDMDRLQGPTAAEKALDTVADIGSGITTVGAVVAPVAVPALAIARATFVGLGLFKRAFKIGKPSVDQMIAEIEAGADAKFKEIDARLDGRDSEKREFDARLQSQEAETARLAALFHGLRSSDPEKHKRLGAMTVSCIYANDLKPESLDDTLGAAVELKEEDIAFLKRIYNSQIQCLRDSSLTDAARSEKLIALWPNEMPAPAGRPTAISKHRGSVARLQAHAFAQFRTPGSGAGGELVFLLEDGAKFYERLQEIGK